jgi:hypothetical protein
MNGDQIGFYGITMSVKTGISSAMRITAPFPTPNKSALGNRIVTIPPKNTTIAALIYHASLI